MIAVTLGKLLLALIIGWLLARRHIFSEDVCKSLAYLVVNISVPFLILGSIATVQNADRFSLLTYMLLGCGFYLLMCVLSIPLVKLLKVTGDVEGVYRAFLIFPNMSFIGYPAASALYGSGCIFYVVLFNLLFNLIFYTYGLRLLARGTEIKLDFKVRNVLNNGTICSILALVMFLLDIHFPEGVTEVMDFMADIAVPLSMLVIGANIARMPLREILSVPRLLPVAVLRLAVLPVLVFLLLTVFGFSGDMRGIATVTIGTPVAAMVSMAGTDMGAHEKLTSAVVTFTTLVSIATIPVMLLILGNL